MTGRWISAISMSPWHDARNGANGAVDLPIHVSVTGDVAASDRSLNKDVSVEASLAESERGLAANVKLAGSGRANDAKKATPRSSPI